MTTTTVRARPRLHLAPVPGGVYLSSDFHQVTLRGWDGFFSLADRCLPLLEQGTSEDALVERVGTEAARPPIRLLLDTLDAHDMLLRPDRWTVPPPDAPPGRLAATLAYLESRSDDPYAALTRITSARVRLVGPEEVTGPAARGLARAGATVLDRRDPAVATVVVRCVETAEELHDVGADPADAVVVPVAVVDRALLVGPALPPAPDPGVRVAQAAGWWQTAARVGTWADEATPGPVCLALAGALAGQLVVDRLADQVGSDLAFVVHGTDPRSEELTLSPPAGTSDSAGTSTLLHAGLVGSPPSMADQVTAAELLATRWRGPLRLLPGDDLPQLPVAMREARPAEGDHGVIGWGRDQRDATVATALAGLRLGPHPPGAVGAAGVSRERWLLDGALRLLTADVGEPFAVPPAFISAETGRLAEAYARLGAEPRLWLTTAPGLCWVMALVIDDEGRPTGRAWAPSAVTAVERALAVAIARAQVAAVTGDPDAVDLTDTGPVQSVSGLALTQLQDQVILAEHLAGSALLGEARRADPVLGHGPWWYGPVRRSLTERANGAGAG